MGNNVDVHFESMFIVDSVNERNEELEEQDRSFFEPLVLVTFVSLQTLRDPVQKIDVNLQDKLRVQTAENGQLTSSKNETLG